MERLFLVLSVIFPNFGVLGNFEGSYFAISQYDLECTIGRTFSQPPCELTLYGDLTRRRRMFPLSDIVWRADRFRLFTMLFAWRGLNFNLSTVKIGFSFLSASLS